MTLSFKQLTPHLWVAQSRLFYTNVGMFLSAGQACLIDPGVYPDEIAAIRDFLAEHEAEAQAIVITHGHWDHVLGPEHFPGVPVIAQANYLEETAGPGAALSQGEIARWEKEAGIERAGTFGFPRPERTFGQRMAMQLGEITLQLAHTPGHAADQLVIYLAVEEALWAADQLSDLEIPYVSHSLTAYERTLQTLARWEVRALVPGHGTPTTDPQEIHARIFEDIAYLATLRDKVAQAVHRGKTVEETVELCQGMPLRQAEANAGPHRLNVESAYLELGGESETPYLGWDRFMDPARG